MKMTDHILEMLVKWFTREGRSLRQEISL